MDNWSRLNEILEDTLRTCIIGFKESCVFKPLLEWHHSRSCMENGAGPHYVGTK